MTMRATTHSLLAALAMGLSALAPGVARTTRARPGDGPIAGWRYPRRTPAWTNASYRRAALKKRNQRRAKR